MSLSELKSDEEKLESLNQKQVEATFFKKGDEFFFRSKGLGLLQKVKLWRNPIIN